MVQELKTFSRHSLRSEPRFKTLVKEAGREIANQVGNKWLAEAIEKVPWEVLLQLLQEQGNLAGKKTEHLMKMLRQIN